MDLKDIRRTVVVALFSDPALLQHLVLKGGNALELAYGVISRGSLDIDVSISDEFDDVQDVQERVFSALEAEFAKLDFVVFDKKFLVLPPGLGDDPTPWWGGYRVEFKLIDQARARALDNRHDDLQRQAHVIDGKQGRTFRIDISKHEYCDGKVALALGGSTIYVYTPEMCVVEKFRAICQQMPGYQPAPGSNRRPRARDFFDIYATVTSCGIDLSLPENFDLYRHVFAAKRVPLLLLSQIADSRDFHRQDWDSVKDTVSDVRVFGFDYYFDFVLAEARKLQPLWVEESPA